MEPKEFRLELKFSVSKTISTYGQDDLEAYDNADDRIFELEKQIQDLLDRYIGGPITVNFESSDFE